VLFRLFRTIYWVLTNPHRRVLWKVLDTSFLLALVVLVWSTLRHSADPFLYLLLSPWVVLITQRGWYEMPLPGRRSRRRAGVPGTVQPSGPPVVDPFAEVPPLPARSSHRSWDPMLAEPNDNE